MSPRYSGFLDPIDGVLIKGWAVRDGSSNQCASVDVFIDDVFIKRIRAESFRADLEAKGYRDGFAAFVFEIPVRFRDGETHVVDVRHAETDQSLHDAPLIYQMAGKSLSALHEKRRWCAQNLVFETPNDVGLAESIRCSGKLAIMSTYHETSEHLRYHRGLMRSLADAGFTVLVVHAANVHRPGLADLDIPNCFTILKRNIGYDFGSYAVGVFAACDHLQHVDELILINDSILRISDGLAELIGRMRDAGADAVSCTDSFEHQYHLQSYMIWFGRKICRSGCLPRFMANYSFTSVKENVIAEGEMGLSRMLQVEGFAIAALFGYQAVTSAWIRRHAQTLQQIRDLPGLAVDWSGPCYKKTALERLDLIMDRLLYGTPLNPSHFFWDTLIEDFGCPFVKRELIIANPCNVPTYFKLGTYFPAGSDAFKDLTEIRHLYGGHLIAPSIPQIDLMAPRSAGPAASEPGRDSAEPTLKLVVRPDAGARHPVHVCPEPA